MSLSLDSRYNQAGIFQSVYAPLQRYGFRPQMPLPYTARFMGTTADKTTTPQSEVPPTQNASLPNAPSPALETLEFVTLGMFSPLNVGSSSGKSLLEKGTESSERLVKRKMVGKGGQMALEHLAQNSSTLAQLEGNIFAGCKFQPETMKVLKDNFGTYNIGNLFGLGMNEASFDGLTRTKWLDAVKSNFATARFLPQLPDGTPPSLGNYLKYGVTGNHARGLVKFLSSGKGIVEAGISCLTMGFAALRTVLTMNEAYKRSEAKGDDTSTSMVKSLFAGAKDLAFFLVGYEVGALAFSVAAAAIALPGLSLIGGLIAAGFAGVATSAVLKSMFGAPISDPEPGEVPQTA